MCFMCNRIGFYVSGHLYQISSKDNQYIEHQNKPYLLYYLYLSLCDVEFSRVIKIKYVICDNCIGQNSIWENCICEIVSNSFRE